MTMFQLLGFGPKKNKVNNLEYCIKGKYVNCTVHVPDDKGQTAGRGKQFSSSKPRPDRLSCPQKLLPSGYRGGSFPGLKSSGGVKLTTHIQYSAEVKMCAAVIPFPHTYSWRGT